jgi:hypothetical protein
MWWSWWSSFWGGLESRIAADGVDGGVWTLEGRVLSALSLAVGASLFFQPKRVRKQSAQDAEEAVAERHRSGRGAGGGI